MLFGTGYDIVKTLETAVAIRQICGNSSVVERYLAKVNVAGSSLVSRSRRKTPPLTGVFCFPIFAYLSVYAPSFPAISPDGNQLLREETPGGQIPKTRAVIFRFRTLCDRRAYNDRRASPISNHLRRLKQKKFLYKSPPPPPESPEARKFFRGKFSETPRKRLHFHAGYGIVYRLWKFSSAGRASALQAEGHRFEPYNFHQRKNSADGICGNSSVVERYLAKVNVAGSSLVSRSREVCAVFSKIAAAAYGAIAKW